MEPWMLRHAAAAIGWGAVALYALGVVKTLGHLHASAIDGAHALAVIPLELHLRNGIAVMANWTAVGIVVLYVVLYWVFGSQLRHATANRGEVDDDVQPARRLGDADPRLNWLGAVMVVAVFLITPWPTIFVAVPVSAPVLLMWGAVWWARKDPGARPFLSTVRWWRVIPRMVVGSMLLFAMVDALYRSDPLPDARLSTSSGVVRGPLIASTDGAFYVGDKNRLYSIVASSEVRSAKLVQRKRQAERSVLAMIGLI
jgi:hypothetical protein